MALLRNRKAESAPATQPVSSTPPAPQPDRAVGAVDRTPTGATWVWLGVAALVLAALIAFMLQNTATVEVSFLWLGGSLPLAMALLIAAAGGVIMTMLVAVTRRTRARRRLRRAS